MNASNVLAEAPPNYAPTARLKIFVRPESVANAGREVLAQLWTCPFDFKDDVWVMVPREDVE